MYSQEQAVEKIKKLINLGKDAGATEAERERAMSLAHKWLAKYNLSMANLVDRGEVEADVLKTHTEVFRTYYMSPASRLVSMAIADLYFCKYMFVRGTKDHVFIGEPANAATAATIAEFIWRAIGREAARRYSGAECTSFAYGASQRIHERAAALKAQSRTMREPGNALVLADVYTRQMARNEEYVQKKYGGPGGKAKSRSFKKLKSDVYQDGRTYADGLNIRHEVE